jgi:hypothetical protein
MGKFFKICDVLKLFEITKWHNYRYNITFKTALSASEFLVHPILINQNLRVVVLHNCLFWLGIIINIDIDYTEEVILEYIESELTIHAIKRINEEVDIYTP